MALKLCRPAVQSRTANWPCSPEFTSTSYGIFTRSELFNIPLHIRNLDSQNIHSDLFIHVTITSKSPHFGIESKTMPILGNISFALEHKTQSVELTVSLMHAISQLMSTFNSLEVQDELKSILDLGKAHMLIFLLYASLLTHVRLIDLHPMISVRKSE